MPGEFPFRKESAHYSRLAWPNVKNGWNLGKWSKGGGSVPCGRDEGQGNVAIVLTLTGPNIPFQTLTF